MRRKDCAAHLGRQDRFQFTHPGKGATIFMVTFLRFSWFQFTHPGKGATSHWSKSILRPIGFNSRTLGRVRHEGIARQSTELEFQFTHPGKGATREIRQSHGTHTVSIHAPWEGCDLGQMASRQNQVTVSIHAPWEGCDTNSLCTRLVKSKVSIHAPWEGCDSYRGKPIDGHAVSIHAPWEGCDASYLVQVA